MSSRGPLDAGETPQPTLNAGETPQPTLNAGETPQPLGGPSAGFGLRMTLSP